jgi:hypothetical protein
LLSIACAILREYFLRDISGNVFIDGVSIFDLHLDVTILRKTMEFLAQRPCPLPMSKYDNATYGPRIYGIRKKRFMKLSRPIKSRRIVGRGLPSIEGFCILTLYRTAAIVSGTMPGSLSTGHSLS